ncbi:hypothetical protein [Actinocorallia lasiicapitis]
MPNRPRILLAAALLQALLGVAAVLFGLFVGFESVAGHPQDRASAIGVTVLALGGGAGMLKVAWGLYTAERWSRSPAVLTQLFSLPVAVSLIQSGQPGWGYPLIVVASVTLVILLTKPITRAL